MDESRRMMAKITRESQRFTRLMLDGKGLGLSENEMIHAVNKSPGISQDSVAKALGKDKGAVARMAQNLEKKGYLVRLQCEEDRRQKALYVTEKGKQVKDSAARCEAFFFQWLLQDLDGEEKDQFLKTLEHLYLKSKQERRQGFDDISKLWREQREDEDFEL